jgi:hypothetical protein
MGLGRLNSSHSAAEVQIQHNSLRLQRVEALHRLQEWGILRSTDFFELDTLPQNPVVVAR